MAAGGPFLTFRRPDGTGGMMDQATAAFIRSTAGAPTQQSLDAIFKQATTVRYQRILPAGNRGIWETVIELSTAPLIEELRECLRISPTDGHLMSFPMNQLALFDGERSLAAIGIVPESLRWDHAWKTDALLVEPEALRAFLQRNGIEVDQSLIDLLPGS
jgi:hypothetical protein